MPDLFAPLPTDNLLPYDGIVNDLGIIIEQTTALYRQLLTELNWQSDKVTLFGKTHITSRKMVWMGNIVSNDVMLSDDENDTSYANQTHHADNTNTALSYTYSGHTRTITAWHPSVFHVKQFIEQKLAEIGVIANFNSCLLNYYPTGTDGMGYHADDEPELGSQPIIASLSLGATRKFAFKHKKTGQKVELNLESGQLIVMRGDTQRFWKHSITKTKTVHDGRISLTFRQMHNNA